MLLLEENSISFKPRRKHADMCTDAVTQCRGFAQFFSFIGYWGLAGKVIKVGQ